MYDVIVIQKVLGKAKSNKSVGVDSLPNEVWKNNASCELLKCRFNKIFVIHVIPSAWKWAIIKPISKNSTFDPRLLLQYRGVALLSTVHALYTSVLNNRIVKNLEENGLCAEEQNGFRQKWSCSEHIFTLSTIIRNRKSQNKLTFLAFHDAEKAFDRIDRYRLLHKLLLNGVKGHIYESIKVIYQESICSINFNNMLTEWFDTNCGVKQGDTLSRTIFGTFINDIVDDVKSINIGINIDGINVCILLDADDIVLLSETDEGLQNLLDRGYE